MIMSFFLDPPALFLLGILLLLTKVKLKLTAQQTRLIGFIITNLFVLVSVSLFLDMIDWPVNFFDWSSPILQPLSGKEWMLHTDVTNITDIPAFLAVFLFVLYPLWIFLGYGIARAIFDPHAINVLPGGPYSKLDVKSQSRAKKRDEETLLAVIRNSEPKEALRTALQKIGGMSSFVQPGDRVVIKVNICGGNPLIKGSFTSLEVAGEIIRLVREAGGIPVAVDSDMIWTDFEPVAEAQGWIKWSETHGIPLINLRKTDCVKFEFNGSSQLKEDIASKLLMDADVIISAPTMKTHLLTGITIAMKNMYGVFPTGEKAKYHEDRIEDVIVDICSAFTPTLTIIDGSIGGEAIGPLSCNPVGSNVIIASNDVVAADAAASMIMGYDPLGDIEHIRKAHELGMGRGDPPFDLTQIEGGPHEKDGQWIRPHPEVSLFYNQFIEQYLRFPGQKEFMNAAFDFLLYDLATLPIARNLTPVGLGTMSDVLSSIFGLLSGRPQGGRKKKQLVEKIGGLSEGSEPPHPTDELKTEIARIKSESAFKSTILSLLVIAFAFIGYFVGGFWDKTLENLDSDPSNPGGLLFVIGLLITAFGLLIYGPKLDPKVLLAVAVLASGFALANEYFLESIDYLTYLDGDWIALAFAVLGYPLFVGFIFGISDWILKYIHLPTFKDRLTNSLPVLGALVLGILVFVIDDTHSLLLDAEIAFMLGTILILLLFGGLALYYGINHTYKQNLTLIIVGALLGAFMEVLGHASGFWSYFSPEVPLFIIFLWSLRVLAIGGAISLLELKMLRYGHERYVGASF